MSKFPDFEETGEFDTYKNLRPGTYFRWTDADGSSSGAPILKTEGGHYRLDAERADPIGFGEGVEQDLGLFPVRIIRLRSAQLSELLKELSDDLHFMGHTDLDIVQGIRNHVTYLRTAYNSLAAAAKTMCESNVSMGAALLALKPKKENP